MKYGRLPGLGGGEHQNELSHMYLISDWKLLREAILSGIQQTQQMLSRVINNPKHDNINRWAIINRKIKGKDKSAQKSFTGLPENRRESKAGFPGEGVPETGGHQRGGPLCQMPSDECGEGPDSKKFTAEEAHAET